jgi:hypothetical protein
MVTSSCTFREDTVEDADTDRTRPTSEVLTEGRFPSSRSGVNGKEASIQDGHSLPPSIAMAGDALFGRRSGMLTVIFGEFAAFDLSDPLTVWIGLP